MPPLKCWLYLPSEPVGQSNSSLRNSASAGAGFGLACSLGVLIAPAERRPTPSESATAR